MLSLRLRPVREKKPFVSWWCSSWTQCLVVLLATQFVCQGTNAQTGQTATQSIRSSAIKSACWNGARYTLDDQNVMWQLGRTYCMSFAIGDLVIINSSAEQMFITNTFGELRPWIGLRGLSGNSTWVDGTVLEMDSYKNFPNQRQEVRGDNCGFLRRNSLRDWGDTACNRQREFLCEEQGVPGPNTWQSCNGAEWRLFEENMTWRDAEQTCQSYGGHLANIEASVDRTSCAKTALQSCFRDGVVTLDRAYVGLTDLFTARDFRWTSNNARTGFEFESPANQICVVYIAENNILQSSNCTVRRPFVCQRLPTQAQDPFITTCSGSVYTYNTVAFSWLEAEQNCSRTGGQLLATAPVVQLNCARQVLALPVFLAGSAVDAINMWVNCSNLPCAGTNQMCPQWNASNGLSSLAPCWLPAPYICVVAIDDCASSPCVAGATCIDDINTFTCQCPSPEQEQLCDPQAQLLQMLPLTLRNDIIVFELVPASRNWSTVAVYMNATASTMIDETSRAGQFAFLIRSSTAQFMSQRVLFQNYTSVLANYTMFAVDLGASSVVAVPEGSGNTIVNLESLTAVPTVMQISVQYRTFNLDCYAVSPCPEWQEAQPGTSTSSFLIPSTQPQSLEVRLVVQYSDTSTTARRKRQASATSETTVPFSLRSPGSRSATTTTFTPPVTSVPGTVDAAGQTSGSDSTGAIVGVVVGLLVGILVAVAIVLLARRRKQKKQEADDSVLSSPVFVNQTSTNWTNGGSSSNRSTHTNGSHGQGQAAGAITDDTYEEVAQRARAKEAAIEMVDLVHGYENPAYGEDQAKRNTLISQYSEADQHCGGITNAIYEALDCEPKDSTLRSNASAEHEGVSYALYETAEDAKGGSRVPVPRETSMYENGGMCTGEGDGKGGDGVDDIVYESADPQYFTLERDEHTESSREARLLSQSSNKRYDEAPRLYGGAGAAAAGSSSTWSRSTGGSHTSSSSNTYDDVVAIMRNSLPYRAPPNKESEVYSTLRHKIYVHLKRTDLHIEHQIGQGHFGQVMRAKWRRSDGVRVPVAVKMLRDDCNSENRISFLKEAIVMGQFFHQNVVTMYGVVDDTDPYIIVLELMRTALRPHLYALSDRDRSVPSAMLGYAIDIANGMEYLARRDFVHRDLAARNILLDEKMTCKIADFGMSRNLEDGDYYISHSTGPIPVKWTAPEALSYSRYSTASDVWSFGIVLYEIFSFGRKPFQGVKNEDVLARIDGGYRPEQPEHCPIAVYELQLLCWNGDADERPSFAEIRKRLQQIRKD